MDAMDAMVGNLCWASYDGAALEQSPASQVAMAAVFRRFWPLRPEMENAPHQLRWLLVSSPATRGNA